MVPVESNWPEDGQFAQATIDTLTKHIAVIDASGRILAVNRAWREFAAANGADPARVSEGANYLDVCDRAAALGEPDAARAAALIRAVIAGQCERAAMEYSCDAPDEERWFLARITRAAGEGPLRLVIAHENVSERRRAENQIVFQGHLLASVEQAVIAADLAGTITYLNPFAERLYGWTAFEAVGRSVADIVQSGAPQEQVAAMMACLREGRGWSGEFAARHRDGREFPVHVTNSPIRNEYGQRIGICSISIDISERQRAERELQLAAMVYQAIGEAIIVLNTGNHIVAVNPAFMQLTGYAEQELLGRSASFLLSDRNPAGFEDEVRHSVDKTGHWQGKMWTRRKNGEEYLEWLMIDTIFDERGRPRRRVGMLSALTDQKLAEETIWRQANFDPLTALPNRSMFHERLEHEVIKAARAR